MTASFIILAMLTVAGATAAMSLRNLVHCALALTVAFAGLAALYLQLDAQFVGFAQLLVYVGAVAILIVFAVLLTRASETPGAARLTGSAICGIAIAVVVFGLLTAMSASRPAARQTALPAPVASVREIGNQLMTKYILPLEIIGLLLTAALIGAVIVAMREKEAE
jgi:NADH-quinone oxidoreductase subunit J